jgi:hypothetical protein
MVTRLGERIATTPKSRAEAPAEKKGPIQTATAEPRWAPALRGELRALTVGATQFVAATRAEAKKCLDAVTHPNLADPKVLASQAKAVTWAPVQNGKLYVDGINYDDPTQGQIGDCYVVSVTSALAEVNAKAIQDAIKDNGNGTYTVRFFQPGREGHPPRAVKVIVDGELPVKKGGAPGYYEHARTRTELWPALIEKAYAKLKGSYDAIGHGGDPGGVLSALTGKPSSQLTNAGQSSDRLFAQLKAARSASKPVIATTFGDSQAARYTNTGVHAGHGYTVLGVSEEGGVKYVQLRNPWGFSEPGNDGRDDGIFKLTIGQFKGLFENTIIGG